MKKQILVGVAILLLASCTPEEDRVESIIRDSLVTLEILRDSASTPEEYKRLKELEKLKEEISLEVLVD